MNVGQFLVGISGALVGVMGWLLVGLYIQRRAHDRQARDAGRAVYFELGANRIAVYIADEYGTFGTLSRSAFDRLLPELSTWMPADELQALVLAYLGHGGYEQLSAGEDLPPQVRRAALAALLEAHRVALELLQRRVFTTRELATLNRYAGTDYVRLMEAADERRPEEAVR